MSNTDGPAALRRLAGDFELTKAACWNESDTASMWTLAAAWEAEREQAAADRAEIANCLENIRELTVQKRISDVVIADVREELHIGPGVSVVEEAGRVYAALAQARALAEQEMARAERAEEQAFRVTMETYRTGLVGDAFRFMRYWQERSLKQSAAARKVAQAYRKVAADGEHDFWTEHNRAETMKAERDACEEENDDLRDEIRIYEAQESELERALAAALSGGAR